MATTPICNPHICRVLLGTLGYFGVVWGTAGYCCMVLWGTVGYCGVLWGTAGYCRVMLGTTGYWGY